MKRWTWMLALVAGCTAVRSEDRPAPETGIVVEAVKGDRLKGGYQFCIDGVRDVTTERGRASFVPVPPGEYAIRIRGSGIRKQRHVVTVRPGHETIVTLDVGAAKAQRRLGRIAAGIGAAIGTIVFVTVLVAIDLLLM